MLIVRNAAGEVLLERRPPVGVWGGLWSLPECQPDTDPADWCLSQLGARPARVEKLPSRRHSFSHFRLDILPLGLDLDSSPSVVADGGHRIWCDPRRPGPLGLAAPIARLLADFGRNSSNDKPLNGDPP